MISQIRRSAAAAAVLATVFALTGCSDEGDTESSSNRGGGTETAETSVENAYIVPRFVPGACAIQVGDTAELRFAVSNHRATGTERLLEVSTPAAESVRLDPAPPLEIPAGETIGAGQPVTPGKQFSATLINVNDGLKPAQTTDVTFQFESFGELTLPVGVEACPAQPQ